MHGYYTSWEVDRFLCITEHLTDVVSTDVFLLVVILEADAERSPEAIQYRLYRLIGEVLAVSIHPHDVARYRAATHDRLHHDRAHAILTHLCMVAHSVRVDIVHVVDHAVAPIVKLKVSTCATRCQPCVDLFYGGEVRHLVRVLIFLVVLTMRCKETKVTHILHLEQFAVVERYPQIGKETVEEVKHVEADARLLAVSIQHPVRPFVFWTATFGNGIDDVRSLFPLVIEAIMIVCHASVAIFRIRVWFADIDKALANGRLVTFLAIVVVHFRCHYCLFLAASGVALSRAGEAQRLWRKYHL